jgi:hypothetical protein
MDRIQKFFAAGIAAALAVTVVAADADAAFTSYVIRNSGANVAPTIQPGNHASWFDGVHHQRRQPEGRLGQQRHQQREDRRHHERGHHAARRHHALLGAGSGPAVAPYFNIWITDGLGNYAVVANEPSNPSFQPLFVTKRRRQQDL